jgi:hypothetical protein
MRGGHAHGADVGRAFVSPEGQLHGQARCCRGGQQGAAAQRAGKQLGQVGGLLVAVDGREDQLDGPLGGQAFGFQRVGQAQAADGDVGAEGAAAVELAVHILAFAQRGAGGQPGQFLRQVLAVQEGRAHLGELHAQFTRQEAGDGQFKLRIRKEEDALASQRFALAGQRSLGALARGCGDFIDARGRDANAAAAACSQAVVPSTPMGKGAAMRCAPRDSRARAVSARKGCASR